MLQLPVVEASVWYPGASLTLGHGVTECMWEHSHSPHGQKAKRKKDQDPTIPFKGTFFFIDLRTDSRPYIVKAPPPPNDAPLGTFET